MNSNTGAASALKVKVFGGRDGRVVERERPRDFGMVEIQRGFGQMSKSGVRARREAEEKSLACISLEVACKNHMREISKEEF